MLLTAALASPHPERRGRRRPSHRRRGHPGRLRAGLDDEIRQQRQDEAPFDPARSFHAAVVRRAALRQGAPEEVGPRCTRLRRGGARSAAGRGGPAGPAGPGAPPGRARPARAPGGGRPPDAPVEDPQDLTALGLRRDQRPAPADRAGGRAPLPGGRRPRHHDHRRPPRHRPGHRPRGRAARPGRRASSRGPTSPNCPTTSWTGAWSGRGSSPGPRRWTSCASSRACSAGATRSP